MLLPVFFLVLLGTVVNISAPATYFTTRFRAHFTWLWWLLLLFDLRVVGFVNQKRLDLWLCDIIVQHNFTFLDQSFTFLVVLCCFPAYQAKFNECFNIWWYVVDVLRVCECVGVIISVVEKSFNQIWLNVIESSGVGQFVSNCISSSNLRP